MCLYINICVNTHKHIYQNVKNKDAKKLIHFFAPGSDIINYFLNFLLYLWYFLNLLSFTFFTFRIKNEITLRLSES